MSEWGRMQDVIHDELDRQGITERVDVNALIECIANVADFFPGLLGTLDAATPHPGLVEARAFAAALLASPVWPAEDDVPVPRDVLANILAASGTGEPGLDVEQVATLRKALAIGIVSWDGDSWYAKDAGYDYDDAEATLTAARNILARLANDKGADPTPEPK